MIPSSEQNDNNFYVGICMAGAVSAGAYTAGVMDYLLEALTEWQKKKDAKAENTPTHNVKIPVIGGASAGGMTGIITAAALNEDIVPVTKPSGDILAEHPENKLYHTWVDLTGEDMFPKMLANDDIEDGGIISLLNSSFIDEVAERAVQTTAHNGSHTFPAFLDDDFKVFTTLTNLRGFGYNINFKGSGKDSKYYMTIHNDYACFRMNCSGKEGAETNETADGWMTLDFKKNLNLDLARNAAMATGAFPVGLKSRFFSRSAAYANTVPWCMDITQYYPVNDPYKTLNVDGGVINNEPFEKVREVLTGKTKQTDEEIESYHTFKSTVLMIDPFPSEKPKDEESTQKLFNVIGLTFSAMIQQMRAKRKTLSKAMDDSNAAQFLIAPTRRRPKLTGGDEDVAGDKAIACGALDGFSGFMSKEFRVHDYFLGRFNCEMFLRDYFTIPEDALAQNTIFRDGYKDVNINQFKGKYGGVQIIPVFSTRPPDNFLPIPAFSSGSNWPVIKESKIDNFKPAVSKRVQALVMNSMELSKINKALLWAGAKVLLNRVLTNAAMNSIKSSLVKHELMK